METYSTLDEIPQLASAVILTIGNFDGVHQGHVAVLKRVREVSRAEKAPSAVLTFSNHPSSILRLQAPTPLITAPAHKLQLLEQEEINHLALLKFTKEFSEQTPEQFIENVQAHLPFTHLILGHDARIGRNRQGDAALIKILSRQYGFSVEYLPEIQTEGRTLSSSEIRKAIQKGDFSLASSLLGRPYSIVSHVEEGSGHGKKIGFPTANLHVEGLCLPPLGVYAIEAQTQNKRLQGVANLGFAPTVIETTAPRLEVHLFEHQADIYGHTVEVFFRDFLRPEVKFESVEKLKAQIEKDIEVARALLS